MLTTQGNLVMVGLNTDAPQVLFNGTPVPGLLEIKVEWEDDERRVKLRVGSINDVLYRQMLDAGISIKRASK